MKRRAPFEDIAGRPTRDVNRASEWEAMYGNGEARWDVGSASPPLVAALARGEVLPPGRALVPGCGYGHEVRALSAAGFDAVGIDFAPAAVAGARRRARETGMEGVRFERRDLFRLPRSWNGSFDLVYEQTCFCAIHPDRRDEYVAAMFRLLRPGGLLLGLFMDIRVDEGPPFGATPAEVRHRFVRNGPFRLEKSRRPHETVPPRWGTEWLAFLRRPPHEAPGRELR